MQHIAIPWKKIACLCSLLLLGCQSIHDNNIRPAAYLPDHPTSGETAQATNDCSDFGYKSAHPVFCAGSRKERDKAIQDQDKALQNHAAEIRQDHWSPAPAVH